LFLKQIPNDKTGCESYIGYCASCEVGYVVDPLENVEAYLQIANDNDIKLTHIFNTHIQADHIAGEQILPQTGFESVSRNSLFPHPGAQAHRACKGDYMFTMLGAAVDIPHKVYKHLSALGPKLYFLRLKKVEHDQDYYLKNMKVSFQDKIDKIRIALYAYIACFDMNPNIVQSGDDLPTKILMDFDKNEELACKHIIQLAQLLGPLRAAVPTWRTEDTQGSSYAYAIPNIEEPTRAITILHNLAAGHALSRGREHITIEDIRIVIQVVLSTASLERSKIFDLLISNNGYLKTRDVVNLLNTTPPTARRAMTELKAVGLVSLDDDVVAEDESGDNEFGRRGLQMTLKEEFKWFLSKTFLNLKNGDTSRVFQEEEDATMDEKEKSPGRITSYNENDRKENPPPRSTHNNLVYDCIIHKTITRSHRLQYMRTLTTGQRISLGLKDVATEI
jgi:hypothetical protein